MGKMKKIKEWLIYQYNSIRNNIEFKNKKKKADKLHKLTGKRYHVVPATSTSLMVVDNSYIKVYNKVVKGRKITINDLLRMSYYSTSVQSVTRKQKNNVKK